VVKARQRRDRLGEMTPGAQRSHTPPKLAGHEDAIIAQVTRQPDMTLDELRGWILAERGISVCINTVWKTLRRLGLTLKKVPCRDRTSPPGYRRGEAGLERAEAVTRRHTLGLHR
jgi:transposase